MMSNRLPLQFNAQLTVNGRKTCLSCPTLGQINTHEQNQMDIQNEEIDCESKHFFVRRFEIALAIAPRPSLVAAMRRLPFEKKTTRCCPIVTKKMLAS